MTVVKSVYYKRTTARLAHDDCDLVLPDDIQQLLSDRIHRQILPLLLKGLGLGELALRFVLDRLHVLGE